MTDDKDARIAALEMELEAAKRDAALELADERERREGAERILLNIRHGGWVGAFTSDFDAHFARYKD